MAGQSFAPLFLRAALAITFLWAGFGKILVTMPVSGEAAAKLANMQVITPDGAGPATAPAAAPPLIVSPPVSTPPASIPSPATVPGPKEVAPPKDFLLPREVPVTKPAPPTKANPGKPDDSQPKTPARKGAELPPLMQVDAKGPIATPATSAGLYTARDFPNEQRVMRVYGLALLIDKVANPDPLEDGRVPIALVPRQLAKDRMPVILAWTAAVSELVAGLFILVGLLARISAAVIVVIMASAMWLTQIGPAIQSGHAKIGFLPDQAAYAVDTAGNFVFTMLLWQLALLCIAMALVFTGPGVLSFDRALFPPRGSKRAAAEIEE